AHNVITAPAAVAASARSHSSINSLIAQAQTNSAYLQYSGLHHSSTNPRIIKVPMVATVPGGDYSAAKQSKIIGFASMWLIWADQHQLTGIFVSQNTSTGHSNPGRPTGDDFATRGVPLVQ